MKSTNWWTQQAALIALDQMPDGRLTADEVVPHLNAGRKLETTAWWIAERHPEWGEDVAEQLRNRLKEKRNLLGLYHTLPRLAGHPAVQKVMAEFLNASPEARGAVSMAMREAKLKNVPECWVKPLATAVSEAVGSVTLINRVRLLRDLPLTGEQYLSVVEEARDRVESGDGMWKAEEMMWLLSAAPQGTVGATERVFSKALAELKGERAEDAREALVRAKLTTAQLRELAEVLPEISTVQLPPILKVFEKSTNAEVGKALVTALRTKRLRAAVQVADVKALLAKYPKSVQEEASKLYDEVEAARKDLEKQLDTMLKDTQPGDVRKGQAVFNSAKAACTACHKIAYVGGQIGPDLTKIGGIRSEKDLLEAIVFPSASFVRSYEPVKVETKSGKSYNGILVSEVINVTLRVSATEEVRIDRKDIDELKPGTVSIMPAGLDQQLTKQELADLVAFLRSLK